MTPSSKPILLIGEALGENEARIGKPFVGPSGVELLRMLHTADVITLTSADRDYISRFYNLGDPNAIDMVWSLHPEVVRTNVFNLHPPGNALENLCGGRAEGIDGWPALLKSKYLLREYESHLERLGDEILALDPNLIISLGNTPLWALTGHTGVSKLRGTTCLSTHVVADYKLLVTYHPAAVLRQWELRPVTIADLAKAPREALSPDLRRPSCQIWIEPNVEDIARFIAQHIRPSPLTAVDIETSGQQITCIGFAPRRDLALVVPIHDSRRKGGCYWPTAQLERQCWELVRSVLEDRKVPKVFQNGTYDIAFLWRAYGIKTLGAVHDTMLLHHALQPESLKGLGFLGSVYTDHGPWKSERKGKDMTIGRDK